MSIQKKVSNLSPEKQCDILYKGVVDVFNKKELLEKIKLNRPLKVKAGFDPSRPDLHFGHSVLINKLRQFQDLGHEVIFVVGDFTACIGDPSGQNKTRPTLSFDQAKKNAGTYVNQATRANFKLKDSFDEESYKVLSFFKRLNVKKTKMKYNSEWLKELSLEKFIIELCSKFTVARQLERKDFFSRYKEGKPIALHEFFYPLLQAYDSVVLKADVEIGGTDQLFNLLLGRDLQEHFGQSPQVVLTLPLLEGLNTKHPVGHKDLGSKMSKSLDNAICFTDSPKDIYGKIMSISDELLIYYWSFFTENSKNLKKAFKKKELNPKKEKQKLAWLLVYAFYGEDKAHEAEMGFDKVFSKKGLPEDIFEEQDLAKEEIGICELVKRAGLSLSNSEAKRGILSGAIKRDGEKILDPELKLDLRKEKNKEFLLSFGKRKFKKINLKWEELHELKAYLSYREVQKEMENMDSDRSEERSHKEKEILNKAYKKLAEDPFFKQSDISLKSIEIKFGNNHYLDKKKGKWNQCSKQNKKIFMENQKNDMGLLKEKVKILESKYRDKI